MRFFELIQNSIHTKKLIPGYLYFKKMNLNFRWENLEFENSEKRVIDSQMFESRNIC